jgi:hypothetical protein
MLYSCSICSNTGLVCFSDSVYANTSCVGCVPVGGWEDSHRNGVQFAQDASAHPFTPRHGWNSSISAGKISLQKSSVWIILFRIVHACCGKRQTFGTEALRLCCMNPIFPFSLSYPSLSLGLAWCVACRPFSGDRWCSLHKQILFWAVGPNYVSALPRRSLEDPGYGGYVLSKDLCFLFSAGPIAPWYLKGNHFESAVITMLFSLISVLLCSGTSVHERPCSRTVRFTNKFSEQKPSRMTNGVSDYEHASWQQRQAESIGAGVSVAG